MNTRPMHPRHTLPGLVRPPLEPVRRTRAPLLDQLETAPGRREDKIRYRLDGTLASVAGDRCRPGSCGLLPLLEVWSYISLFLLCKFMCVMETGGTSATKPG